MAALPAALLALVAWTRPPTPPVSHMGAPWRADLQYDPAWEGARGAEPTRMARRDAWGNDAMQALWNHADSQLLVVLHVDEYGLSPSYRVHVFDRDMRLLRRGWAHVGLFDAPLEPVDMTESAYCLLEVQAKAGGEWDLAVGACRKYIWTPGAPTDVGWEARVIQEVLGRNYVHAVPVLWDGADRPENEQDDDAEPGGIRWAEAGPSLVIAAEPEGAEPNAEAR